MRGPVPAALLCMMLAAAPPLCAKTLRFASAFDPQTMDPHSIALLYHSRVNADLPLIPLYRRTLTWVMRPNVSVAQWPNDILELRYVQID